MGADQSKPSSGVKQHVFSADHPVRFSAQLVDSLQKNTFTDSTRSRQQEVDYQQRLTTELQRLRDQETHTLESGLVENMAHATSSNDMSRDSVTKEIDQLKAKLANRKKLEHVDADLTKAKEAVVSCLRTNDRRPLDCWKEVEAFKKEVGRLEKDFVEKTIR